MRYRPKKELSSRQATRPGRATTHQARRLAKLVSDVYYADGAKVYLLDSYRYGEKDIAIVSLVDESGIFEFPRHRLILAQQ